MNLSFWGQSLPRPTLVCQVAVSCVSSRDAPAVVSWHPRGHRRTPFQAKSLALWLDTSWWKSTRASPSVSRARNLGSECV